MSYFQLSSRCLDILMKHCLSCLIYYLKHSRSESSRAICSTSRISRFSKILEDKTIAEVGLVSLFILLFHWLGEIASCHICLTNQKSVFTWFKLLFPALFTDYLLVLCDWSMLVMSMLVVFSLFQVLDVRLPLQEK